MAILSIAATDRGLTLPEMPDMDPRLPLARAIAATPKDAPILIMVHGFSHHPDIDHADPRQHIYAPTAPVAGRTSWPLALGFGPNSPGLCIAFSWPGRPEQGTRLTPRAFARIYRRSEQAGIALAQLLGWLTELAPDRQVSILAHSLGARVVLSAPRASTTPNVARILFMGAAALACEARDALRRSRTARAARFINVTARGNDLFDLGFERLAARHSPTSRSLGEGLGTPAPNWLDLQLDHPETEAILARHGIGLARTSTAISHASFYTRPGAMAFYRKLLCDRDQLCLEALARDLRTVRTEPRGTGLTRALATTLRNLLVPDHLARA